MRTGKNGFRRITAMICALALCASMMPTAVFAAGDQDANGGTDTQTSVVQPDENNAPDSGNTLTEDTTRTGNENSSGSGEKDTTEGAKDGEGTGDGEEKDSATDGNGGEEKKPADTADEDNNAGLVATYSANEPAAAPKGVWDETATSDDKIFSVDYYNGAGGKTDLTIIALDEEGQTLDTLHLGEVYASTATMSITINNAYKTVYELDDVTGDDGVYILDWSGDFNDAQSTTFTWADTLDWGNYGKGTIYLHLKTASHVLELKNSEKGVDLGTITWKEGGKQLTTVKVYLNYDLVYTSEPLAISNALNNFVLDLKDGYYFNTVTMEDIQYTSSIKGQVITYNSVGNYNHLTFGSIPSIFDGTNTVSLYVFNYNDGVQVKYDRFVNNGIVNVDAACPSLDIAYTVNGYNTQFTYTDLDSYIYLPKNTKVTTTANVQDGYYFEYWHTADAAVGKNNLYTIGADGNPILQYTGPLEGQIGHVAFSQSMMAEYGSAFTSGIIGLYMTDGDRPVIDYYDYRITYCPNGENVTPADNQVQYFYRSSQGTYGTSIRGCMFTRDGYEFLGWNTDPDGKGTAYAPDAIYGDDVGENDLTLYAQWKKIDEPETKPDKPGDPAVEKLLKDRVLVKCVNTAATHSDTSKSYGALEGGYTVGEVQGDAASGYTVDVTIQSATYVTQYNTDTRSKHVLADGEQSTQTITLQYNGTDGEWTVKGPEQVTVKVTCDDGSTTPTEPPLPDEEDLQKLLNEAVTVKCTNGDNAHDPMYETYSVLKEGYTLGTLQGDEKSGYTVDVTLLNSAYLAAFNEKTGVKHELDPVTQNDPVITLCYVAESKTWEVDSKTPVPVVITVTCKDAVKADIIVTPEKLTIYRGGEKTEETGSNVNIVNGEGKELENDGSLPEIGFSLQLSTELNNRLRHNLGVESDTVLDLSDYITLTAKTTSGQTLTWDLTPYGEGTSATNAETGYYIYKIVPTDDSDGAKLNVSFRDKEGNYVGTDDFDIQDHGTLAETYTMMIYGDRVDASTLYATITYDNGKTETASVQGAEDPATLTVRYTNEDATVTQSYNTVAEASKAEDGNNQSQLTKSAYMIRGNADHFMVNNSDVQVDDQHVSLLFDDIAETTDTNYADTLNEKAIEAVKQKDSDVDTSKLKTEAKYLDLVDATNGNVWVTSDDEVTIYWPFPAGTDASTTFYVAHFDGLDRDKDVSGMNTAVDEATASMMEVETDQYGVYFTTSSFSPYVLVWDTTTTSGGGGSHGGGDGGTTNNNNNTNNNTTTVNVTSTAAAQPQAATAAIPQTGDAMPVGLLGGLAAAAAAGFAALFVIRKRKQNG